MSSQVYFLCVVFLFIIFKTIAAYSDDLYQEYYRDTVANVYQSTEQDIEQRTTQPERSPGCPYRCHCKKSNTHDVISVDCSSKGLTTVPDLPETTVQLSLWNNSISNISCESFEFLHNLEILNLAFNKIHRLSSCVFVSQSSSLQDLKISDNNMTDLDVKLFQNLSRLETLDLSRNFITHLASRTFSDLVHLVSLDLSFNFIESIAPDGFKGLYSLKTLSLLNNRLDNYTSFHKDVFQDLGALEMLDVKANLGSINEAVSALRNLTHLYIQVKHNYKVLGPGFRQLTNLRVLNLKKIIFRSEKRYKQSSSCFLDTIPSNFFGNIGTEKDFELYLSFCYFRIPDNATFIFPSTLVTLDLTDDYELDCRSTEWNWTKSLINTRISYLGLTMAWAWGDYQTLEDECFRYLTKTNLKTLLLKRTFIRAINTQDYFPTTVERLDLSNNYISLGDVYFAYYYSHQRDFKLKKLYANGQHFFHPRTAKQISQQTSDANIAGDLNASYTHVNGTDAEIWSLPSQIPDSGSRNGSHILKRSSSSGETTHPPHAAVADVKLLKVFNKEKLYCLRNSDDQDPKIQIMCLPPDLEAIYANSGIALYDFDSVPHIRIYDNTVLRHVELADNPLKAWLGPVENVPSLQYLDLSRNQCRNLSVDFFKYMVSLQTLVLKENFIGLSLTADINGLTFSTLTKLKLLDLSKNTIEDLSRSAFINNRNLQTLDLSNNQLSEFQPTISTILNMSLLNLSGNLLAGLSEQTSRELNVLKSRNKHFTVNVLYNHLLLSCDYLPFLNLLLSKPQIFFRVADLEFQSSNGAKFSYKDLVHHFPLLARECLAQRFFILILIIFFVVVSTVIICAVIYHKRWILRYLYYIGRRRMHIGEHVVDYAPDADVFITYDQDDFHWRRFMQQTFLPGLNQRDITYILGETDFPGGDLMAHVTGAVVGTRKTVVLLSSDIFDDHHREYEMNLSIMREMDTRSLKIVPIFVEEVDLSLYPREIELFLRHQWERCLRYSDTDDFWRRFLDAVRENN